MIKNLSKSTIIGFISGIILIIFMYISYDIIKIKDTIIYPICFTIYFIAIGVSIYLFSKSNNEISFKNLFSEGFKCFIVITLLMVLFSWFNFTSHPEYKLNLITDHKKYLETVADKTPLEKETSLKYYSDNLSKMFVIQPLFSFLFSGALFSVIISFLISNIKFKK